MERRKHKRYNKRLKVSYGEKDFVSSGFTGNVSSSGLFIIATTNVKLGTRLHLQLHLESEGKVLYQEGVIARIQQVPPELRSVVKGGFGVRFITQRELLMDMMPNLAATAARVLSLDTAWKLSELYEKELKRGGVFIWSDTTVAIDTIINVEFELGYANHSITLAAKVVTVVPNPDGKFGLACIFMDGPKAVEQFLPYLPKA